MCRGSARRIERVDVEPAAVEAHALADDGDAAMLRIAPADLEEPRRAFGRAIQGSPSERDGFGHPSSVRGTSVVVRWFGGRDSDGSSFVGPADDAACAGGTGKEAAGFTGDLGVHND